MPRLTYNAAEFSDNGKLDRRRSDVAIIGCPFDLGTTRYGGQAEGPAHIRFIDQWDDCMRSPVYGIDPFEALDIVDCGDVEFSNGDTRGGWQAIRDKVAMVYLNVKQAVILLGGDHSITAQALAAISQKEGPLTVFHFDAQPDTWTPDAGMELDHGTWVRYAIDNGYANRVVQFGVRGWGVSQKESNWAEKNDVTTYYANRPGVLHVLQEELRDTSDAVYLSVDLGVLDPAFCPAVVFQEPGGMTTRELLGMVHMIAASGKMVGGDVVELVPAKDIANLSVKNASRCVAQMLTGLACVEQ